MSVEIEKLDQMGKKAKTSARKLAHTSTAVKNQALLNIADALTANQKEILAANTLDCDAARASGMGDAMLDRLILNPDRLQGMAEDVRSIAALPDPVGESFDTKTIPNGLIIGRRRVPLGVIACIYESRPNVTIDISSLCLKSGNAIILRGGKETINSNKSLVKISSEACIKAGLPSDTIQYIENPDRVLVEHLMTMKWAIDLLIPRGGANLIKFVRENATMAVVTGGIGVCHTYIDKAADIEKAVAIAYNAKVQRPTVCNALDTLLVHKNIAENYLPKIAKEWAKAGVNMHCDKTAMNLLKAIPELKLSKSTDEDWGKEFLALIAAVKVVNSLDEALDHIEQYGSGHSEAIVSEDYTSAMRFLDEVDTAAVYVNASTRFTDGAQFGLGAEVGISTQKLHARGPLGLKELTTYKWTIMGTGQVRP
ncbi:MAG: glutamate-5-semialdehyde dehydrogenase [Chloroflexi bacterium]|jgi:glutamate-5-semialdehyde dehydrogenase|nr:glutamate-5-semialdehyde dehydrogenase [Chloroflexota bacterium]MBT7082375.1 glutamate-5-semialdehyde dehydrogenase [Chloroflexota bacterium]MBT7290615.1 glutamate-5-semialdehyde dehydrogenase [Chloroflexota bacterium]